ncbi:MAG: hypothetical protein WC773_03010 [Patescibacteria group bacterium]|jgi:hypothetical protein
MSDTNAQVVEPLSDVDRLTKLEQEQARMRDQFTALERRVSQLATENERLNRRTLPMQTFGGPPNDGGGLLDDTLDGMPPL